MTENAEGILKFWFAPGMDEHWYADSAEFDARVRDRFMTTYEAARDGKLAAWRERAHSMLALIIVLDQFPRNMFRKNGRAFATDRLALGLTKEGIAKGFDRELSGSQREFFYMPLMHSEALADHDILTTLWLGDDRFPREHRDVIVRFGRYPHRNAALGRINSLEEAKFLGTEN